MSKRQGASKLEKERKQANPSESGFLLLQKSPLTRVLRFFYSSPSPKRHRWVGEYTTTRLPNQIAHNCVGVCTFPYQQKTQCTLTQTDVTAFGSSSLLSPNLSLLPLDNITTFVSFHYSPQLYFVCFLLDYVCL